MINRSKIAFFAALLWASLPAGGAVSQAPGDPKLNNLPQTPQMF